jgi:deoxyadenosine/deoxycytidine kinase/NTP pyrophosphatase (non-canonical NTP hydrolase)
LEKHRSSKSWYVIIEGAIGVGKTTLARMLRDHYVTGLQLEVFEENPFLASFYQDRARYAFQTQMFFLLSRYRQQQQLAQRVARESLISDYMFAKDWLFAQLNLKGDEWDVYQQIQSALAEQIPEPDLIVYLQADTDVLMGRIAQRDRTYERDMDREYIDALRQTYEEFFHEPHNVPVLFVDTNHLNFVTRPDDFRSIVERINSALGEGTFQRTLPELAPARATARELAPGRYLADFQRFHVEMDKTKGFNTNVFFNYLCLSEEMGELGSELAQLWREQEAMVATGELADQALRRALEGRREAIESEMADCMAYLLKIANYTGIDLETAYLNKMNENEDRTWDQERTRARLAEEG